MAKAATWHAGQYLEKLCQGMEADSLIEVSHRSPAHITTQ